MTSDYAKKKANKKKEAIKVKLGKKAGPKAKRGWWPSDSDPKADPEVEAMGKKKVAPESIEKTEEEELCQQVGVKVNI